MPRTRQSLLACLASAGLALAVAAPASADPPERNAYTKTDAKSIEDFCDVPGLTIDFTLEATIKESTMTRGKDRTEYFAQHYSSVRTHTYQGMTIKEIERGTTDKDRKVADNGAGTLTVRTIAAGSDQLWGQGGKLIAKDDGQIRLLLVVDKATGDVISGEVDRASTGTNDDFCAAMLKDWGTAR